MKDTRVRLENLGHGAAAELFEAELVNVIANIIDPNTKADAARQITLKMKIKPSNDRSACTVEISCESKLAPQQAFESTIFVGMEHGEAVATEYNPSQGRLFEEPAIEGSATTPAKITKIA